MNDLERIKQEMQRLAQEACASVSDIMSFTTSVIKDIALQQLQKQMLSCKKCPMQLHNHATIYGNIHSDLLIINDCASKNLSKTKSGDQCIYPFSEQEYKVLQIIFSAFKQDIRQAAFISSVNCVTYDEISNAYRTPNSQEIANCSRYVQRMLDIIKPKMIILLGNIALNIFFSSPISKVHGKNLNIFSVPAMPIYHPAYISSLKDEVIKDKRKEEMMIDWRNAFQMLTAIRNAIC